MIDSQDKTPNTFGDFLRKYMKENRYSFRKYAELVDESHSNIQNVVANDTATFNRVSKMIQHDHRLIKVVEEYFNSILPNQEQIKINQVAEEPPTYNTKPIPNQITENQHIIDLQKYILELQEENIKLQKQIINNQNQ